MRRFGALLGVLLATAGPAAADVVDDNVAAVVNPAGQVELFARGADGAIYSRLADGGTWSSIGGSAGSGPAAMVRGDGALDVFVRGSNEEILHRTRRGSEWGEWTSLGGQWTSAPAATERRGTGYIELLVRGTDNALHHRWYEPSGGWRPWASFGGGLASGPAVVSRKQGWADLFVRGTDNHIHQKFYDPGTATWSDWFETPRVWATLSAPSATVPGEGRIEVFHRGTSEQLYQRSFNGENWGEGDRLVDERPLETTPTAVAEPNGRLRLFTRMAGEIWVKTLSAGGWSQWTSMGPVEAPAPSSQSPSPGSPPPAAPPAPPAPPQAPVAGGNVEIGTGLGCTPRGGKVRVSVKVRKRTGRRKPRVQRVVFFYRKGKGSVRRGDRRAPYVRKIPVDLKAGTHRVYARIYYKRPGTKRVWRKTVSRRFVVCA